MIPSRIKMKSPLMKSLLLPPEIACLLVSISQKLTSHLKRFWDSLNREGVFNSLINRQGFHCNLIASTGVRYSQLPKARLAWVCATLSRLSLVPTLSWRWKQYGLMGRTVSSKQCTFTTERRGSWIGRPLALIRAHHGCCLFLEPREVRGYSDST